MSRSLAVIARATLMVSSFVDRWWRGRLLRRESEVAWRVRWRETCVRMSVCALRIQKREERSECCVVGKKVGRNRC